MKTIKLPILLNENDLDFLQILRKQQSSVSRISYKMFKDKKLNQKDIRHNLKNYNLPNLDSWFIQCGILQGKALYNRFKEQKIIFGGKKNWIDYTNNKITKDEFNDNRLLPLQIEGEAPKKGNRKFNLDIKNNKIIFKPNKNRKINIKLPKLHKNIKKDLLNLEQLTVTNQIPYSIRLSNDYIVISFESNQINRLKKIISKPLIKKETRINAQKLLDKLFKPNNSNRIIGIDQNPDYIGLSILDFDKNDEFKIIHKEVISFKELNKKSGYSSDNYKTIKFNNKKKFELIEIVKYMVNLGHRFNCGKFVIEELKFKNNLKGREVNRLCLNKWHRGILVENLSKRCDELNIELVTINAAYTSFIGNLMYGDDNCPDMIAASIEICRRGYHKYKKGWFYPELKHKYIKNRWKKDIYIDNCGSWKELFTKIKKSKVKYRFSLVETVEFFRHKSYKSKIDRFIFL